MQGEILETTPGGSTPMLRKPRRDPAQVWVTLPRVVIDRIEHLAIDLHGTRSEAIAVLIEAGFERLAVRDGGKEEE